LAKSLARSAVRFPKLLLLVNRLVEFVGLVDDLLEKLIALLLVFGQLCLLVVMLFPEAGDLRLCLRHGGKRRRPFLFQGRPFRLLFLPFLLCEIDFGLKFAQGLLLKDLFVNKLRLETALSFVSFSFSSLKVFNWVSKPISLLGVT